MDMRNHDLKEDIREYWSKRSATFDVAFGHRIPPGPELDAWAGAVRDAIGPEPQRVLELACGTGEVTNVLLSLGHDVTALDFPKTCSASPVRSIPATRKFSLFLRMPSAPWNPTKPMMRSYAGTWFGH
jgi:SAM-dependent methyltransferase